METAAERVGKRIREIRMDKGLSQAELGNRVGLTADRIQKYENGARKPKIDLLEQIATALGVEPLALLDPVQDDEIGVMYTLFALEKQYGLKIKRVDGCLYFYFGDGITGTVNDYLDKWERERRQVERKLERSYSEKEKKLLKKSYNTWKWRFPKSLNHNDGDSKAERKEKLQEEIIRLKKQLSFLNDD